LSYYIRPAAIQQPERLGALALFLLLLGVYTLCFTGLPDNPDAEVEFQTTSALARTHSLALSGTPEAEAIIALGYNVREGGPGREGRHYSWFGLGQALGGLPFYAGGHALARLWPEVQARHARESAYGVARSEYFEHLLVGWRNPLLAAWSCVLIALCARRLSVSRANAYAAALSYGLATFALAQARSTLSDVQATFLLLLAFHHLLKLREQVQRRGLPQLGDLFVLGAALGGAFLTRVALAPAVLALGLTALLVIWQGLGALRHGQEALLRRRRERALVSFAWLALPALASIAFFLWANRTRFGDPFETGYGDAVFSGNFFSYPKHYGLAGLLVAPGKGLLWLAPGILLVPFGAWRAWQRGERLWCASAAVIAVAVFAPVIGTQTWHGAWTYGPRYVLPALPFLWIGVGHALDALAQAPLRRVLAWLLLTAGLSTSVPAALVDHMTHQDLALQAARLEHRDVPGADQRERDEHLFQLIQWDFDYAAPWAHWRILRHRVARGSEDFPAHEIFFVAEPALLRPEHERERGFRHLAWVYQGEVLGGPAWIGLTLGLVMLGLGALLSRRALDPTWA
jgi:hypothetical protein